MQTLLLFLLLLTGIIEDASAQEIIYSSDIHISEFLPHPAGGGTTGEFIELHNTSGTSQDISGWVLDDIENGGSNPFTIPLGTMIADDEYLAFYTVSPHVALNDTGDHVRLIRPDAVVQDDVVYTTSKEGYSYNRTDAGGYEELSAPTPNEKNSNKPVVVEPSPTPTPSPVPILVYSPDIHINEFLPNPKGDDGTGEFIELINTGNEDVDISEWVLDDVEGAGSTPFSIPDETIISAHGFIVVYRTLTKISLNNDIDHVRLIRPDTIVQDDVPYSDAKEAHSFNKTDAEKYEKSSSLTPGAANIISISGTPTPKPEADEDTEKESKVTYDFSTKIVINEFLPNPEGEDTELEFIEIKSLDKRNINLFGYSVDDGDGGSAPYLFTKEDSIAPGKILVLFRPKTKIALNNDKDSVQLFDPNKKSISEAAYDEKIIEGQSYNKNANGEWQWSDMITPGKENTISIQEILTPTPKPKVAKKVSVAKVQALPRVLSAVAASPSSLPWVEQAKPEGVVSRSVVSLGNSPNMFTLRQGIFVFFWLSLAVLQLVSGIRHKERIWQKR